MKFSVYNIYWYLEWSMTHPVDITNQSILLIGDRGRMVTQ